MQLRRMSGENRHPGHARERLRRQTRRELRARAEEKRHGGQEGSGKASEPQSVSKCC